MRPYVKKIAKKRTFTIMFLLQMTTNVEWLNGSAVLVILNDIFLFLFLKLPGLR